MVQKQLSKLCTKKNQVYLCDVIANLLADV